MPEEKRITDKNNKKYVQTQKMRRWIKINIFSLISKKNYDIL